MYSRNILSGLVVLLLVQATTVFAESDGEINYEFYRPTPPLPPELQFTYHHASTALEGALRGQAQVIHASGNFWLAIAQAMICREQARALALDNKRQWIEHRIGMQQLNELKRKRHTEELRRANEGKRAAKYAVYRLNSTQLDRLTGAIVWPTALDSLEFERLRSEVQTSFKNLFVGTAPVALTATDISNSTRKLGDALHRHRNGLGNDKYFAAQKFLCGLRYEVEVANTSAGTFSSSPNATAQIEQFWLK